MKKLRRIISVVIILCLMFLLCGCDYIDDLRKTHAKFVDGYEEIELCGDIYKYIDVSDDVELGGIAHSVYVTEPDVPLLLSRDLCEYGFLNNDRSILTLNNSKYVREDIYDKVNDELNNSLEFTRYCFETWKNDEEIEYYYLTDTERDKINGLFYTAKYNCYFSNDEDYPGYDYRSISIYSASESGAFRAYAFSVFKTDDGYRIYLQKRGPYCLTDGIGISEEGDLVVYYSTPETDVIFDRFFSMSY